MFLTATDTQAIEARVTALETDHGVDVVTVIVGKSDVYPETVWKAFALGASLTALAKTIGELLRTDWTSSTAILWSFMAIVGIGALCALACVYVPSFARLFVRESRATLEVAQYAKTQFLDRQLFATPQRTAILVLVSLLERRVVILADIGFREHVSAADWDAIIARMTEKLKSGATGAAVLAGLNGIGELLSGKHFARGAGSVFANAVIEEPGA